VGAPVTIQFSPSNIWQGAADIYLDVAAPPSAIPPIIGTNTLVLNANGEPNDSGGNGIHLGLTEGPCSVTFAPKFNEIRADNFAGAVDAAFVSATAEIDFAIKETQLSRFPKYFSGILTGTYFDLGTADLLRIGSMRSSAAQFHTVLLIGGSRTVPNGYMYALAYRCTLKSAISGGVDRKKETVYKVKFAAICDVSRVATDQTMQILRDLVPRT
jgi:hypothetical protein